jgi:cysteine desulfurase
MTDLARLKQNVIDEGGTLPIYLDNQATTATDPRVVEAMMPYFSQKFGNPHSRSHSFAWEAEEACELARLQVANLMGASPKEIIFTSGATESNNMALKGIAKFYGSKKKHIVTLTTEHKCVLDTCRHLEQDGFKITYLPVQPNGLVNLEQLKNVITDDTMLVSIMAICREKGVFFHSDIAQAFGKIPINVDECNIDLASISGHKIYGPGGIGALYIRRRPRVRLTPIINGGGQERGFRSGTLATPLVVGLGKAASIAQEEMAKDHAHVKKLFDKFLNTIQANAQDIVLNGDKEQRYPGNLNLSFAYIEGESMILAIKDLAVSSGSACTSSSLEPSYVLRALGVDEAMAHTSIRFGFGRFTTEAEVDYAAALMLANINKLRELSPLWEMVQEGIDINEIKWASH